MSTWKESNWYKVSPCKTDKAISYGLNTSSIKVILLYCYFLQYILYIFLSLLILTDKNAILF